jgi:hypothetical protein
MWENPAMFALGLDAAYLPASIPAGVTVGLGYLVSRPGTGHATHPWTAADWARARLLFSHLVPIYVPVVGETPAEAAASQLDQTRALALAGGIVALDREAGRADLTAGWVAAWAALIRAAGYPSCGYTSLSTQAAVMATAYPWIGAPSPRYTWPAGAALWQYAYRGPYDLSQIRADVPLCPSTPGAPTVPTPPTKDPDMYTIYECNGANFVVNDNGNVVYIGKPAGLDVLESRYGPATPIDALTLRALAWANTPAQNEGLTAAKV